VPARRLGWRDFSNPASLAAGSAGESVPLGRIPPSCLIGCNAHTAPRGGLYIRRSGPQTRLGAARKSCADTTSSVGLSISFSALHVSRGAFSPRMNSSPRKPAARESLPPGEASDPTAPRKNDDRSTPNNTPGACPAKPTNLRKVEGLNHSGTMCLHQHSTSRLREFQTGIIWASGSKRRRSFGSLVTMASRRSLATITTEASITSAKLAAPHSSPHERARCSSRGTISTSSLRRNRAKVT